MNHLTRSDYAGALQVLARIEAQAGDVDSFARAVVLALHDYISSELTTLLVCDLRTGQLQGVGLHGMRLGAVGNRVRRRNFRPRALSGGNDRRIGLAYAMAAPLFSDPRTLVSVVLKRRGLDFDQCERERLDLLRPHLAFLYRHACKAVVMPPDINPPGLTLREGEVMQWLARGKTDAEIAALLSISPRTVQKHLEHIYVKLGVETRTAAVMRALAVSERSMACQSPHHDQGEVVAEMLFGHA